MSTKKNKGAAAVAAPSINATLAERGSKYGDFIDHAMVTQRIKDAIFYHTRTDGDIVRLKLKPDQIEAIEMIAHKLGRIANGDPDYIDSWHDIAGYATLVEQRLTKDQGVARA